MRLQWTHRAQDDLVAIGRYIAADNPRAARAWVERLRARARRAAQMPWAGRVVPELGRDDIREVFLRTYRIVYHIRDDTMAVLTIFEGHRPMPADVVEGPQPKDGE